MLVVPNHHVIVPRTHELSTKLPHIVDDAETRRQAHVQHLYADNLSSIELDFVPLSDLWIEVYIDGYRVINPRYATEPTRSIGYETYNLRGSTTLEFAQPITGNVTIVCDTLPYNVGETLHQANVSGMTVTFDNIQNYDIFEKRFNPARFPMRNLDLVNTVLRVRVGDGLYAAPLVMQQPCYGHARVSKDRKSIVYIPRVGFQGWDYFGYTLMSQRGQMGKPETCSIRVYGEDLRYNWSANIAADGVLAIRDIKHPFISIIANQLTSIEFFYYTKSVADDKNYRVGLFGQYRDEFKDGRYAVFLESTGTDKEQTLVFQYCVPGVSTEGDPIYINYRLSSRRKLEQKRWHHVVIQIDGTSVSNAVVSMYINGFNEIFYDNNFISQTSPSDDYFLIGAVNDRFQTQIFNGYISNFRILVDELPYTGERISVPRRPYEITANTKIISLYNGIQDPESVQDMSDITRIQKSGNVRMVEIGPFSPVVISSNSTRLKHGDVVTITHQADYICTYTQVPYTINANVYIGAINNNYVHGPDPVFEIKEIDDVGIVARTDTSLTGNFIIDDVDRVELTVDTLTIPVLTRHRVDFFLDQWPLMVETFDVYAEPDGLIMHIEATNDGFARDLVNFEHGTLTSLGAYNASLGGYFNFNGTTDIITGTNNYMNNIIGDITCEVWFRIQTPTAGNVRIFGKGYSANLTYELSYTTSTNEFRFSRQGYEDDYQANLEVVYSQGSSITSAWCQLVGVTENSLHKLYLNGIKVAEKTAYYSSFLSSNAPYTIGSDGVGSYHNGQVSVIRLFNRALSDSEVADKFNDYRARYGL